MQQRPHLVVCWPALAGPSSSMPLSRVFSPQRIAEQDPGTNPCVSFLRPLLGLLGIVHYALSAVDDVLPVGVSLQLLLLLCCEGSSAHTLIQRGDFPRLPKEVRDGEEEGRDGEEEGRDGEEEGRDGEEEGREETVRFNGGSIPSAALHKAAPL